MWPDRHPAAPLVSPRNSHRTRGRPRLRESRLTRPDARLASNGRDLVDWTKLPEDGGEHEAAWIRLCDWVEWLTARYRLTREERLPACWSQHPELIEELTALRAWRIEAYGPEGSGQQAVYWHQALTVLLDHIAQLWAAGCRAGHR